MPVYRETLPKKAEAWKDYAVRQYYEVYKPRGYTYAETLQALGNKRGAGKRTQRKRRAGARLYD